MIIPEDVVKIMGPQFFYDLIDRFHKPVAQDGGEG
jgi:hypothetical protein